MWDSQRALLGETNTSTCILEPCSLDLTVQVGPLEHLVSSRTCEDRHERSQSLPCWSERCTLEFDWLIREASKRGYLGIVTLKHDSSEDGASRSAISVTDWNRKEA